jgi:hypothetical protein
VVAHQVADRRRFRLAGLAKTAEARRARRRASLGERLGIPGNVLTPGPGDTSSRRCGDGARFQGCGSRGADFSSADSPDDQRTETAGLLDPLDGTLTAWLRRMSSRG